MGCAEGYDCSCDAERPKLILGDEPTSALDVTSQLQVIRELELLKREYDISMIMISHNVGVISRIADTIAIMYGGRMVEYGTRDDIIKNSVHPYTKALLLRFRIGKEISRKDFLVSRLCLRKACLLVPLHQVRLLSETM